jgi:hypothetical protein
MNPVNAFGSTFNPWLLLGVLLLWLASLVAVGSWQREDGATVERSAWQGRENAELRTANGRIRELEEGARHEEAAHALALQEKSAAYERKLIDEQDLHARDIAAVRAGARKLRDPGATTRCPVRSDAAQAGPGAGERDGEAGGELSPAAAEFLLGEASRANAIVEQLTACQAIVIEDRKLCGGTSEHQAHQQ